MTAEIYALPSSSLIEHLNSNPTTGLSSQVALQRHAAYGPNEIPTKQSFTILSKIIEQLKNPLILLLLGAASVSFLLQEYDDSFSVLLAVIIVVTVGFIQEYRSEKTLQALKNLSPPTCCVLRDGTYFSIEARNLVIGDIVRISYGDLIPADLKIINSVELETDESMLTGETKSKRKSHVHDGVACKLERNDLLFMGTLVRHGYGTGIVFATAVNTEYGKIFSMINEADDKKSPLQEKLDYLGQQLTVGSFAVITILFIVGVIQGKGWLQMFTISVSLAVAAIPEGLPIVSTVTLALGAIRLAQKKVIVKRLSSVEALGSIDYLCVDKTGTLTENSLVVTKAFSPTIGSIEEINNDLDATSMKEGYSKIFSTATLCNNAVFYEGHYHGNAVDCALINFVSKLGLKDCRKVEFKRIAEVPFSSDRKWMSATYVNEIEGTQTVALKGGLDYVLSQCKFIRLASEKLQPIELRTLESLKVASNLLELQGLKTIAFAIGSNADNMEFLGILGLHDPPRKSVSSFIDQLKDYNVNIMMITGDSKGTALSIAKSIGMGNCESFSLCGTEIGEMKSSELSSRISKVSVISRATPQNKLDVVKCLQERNHIVGMTGDGVNDGPALKFADIGIALGNGSDVSKEAADIVLLENDLSKLILAIQEGRLIFQNIKHFVQFQLSTSIAALTLISLSSILGYENPLNAMQILWINIIMDGPPAQCLALEPQDSDVLLCSSKQTSIINRSMLMGILQSSFIMVFGTLLAHSKGSSTFTFTTFIFFDMFNAFTCRSEKKSLFSIGIFSNFYLFVAILFSILGQLLVIYTPFFQSIFQTESLSFSEMIQITLLSSSILWIDEVVKLIKRRKEKRKYKKYSEIV